MGGLSIQIEARELALAERFTIARETWDKTENVFVTIRYEGAIGIGEASPASRWGESVDSVISQLERADIGELRGPFDLEGVKDLLPPGSARCALDIALHDLASSLAGLPLSTFLGLDGRPAPPTSVTIPIATLDEMVARAEKLADHPILKMKVGFDGDVDAVQAIREVYGGTLRVDANEGWRVDEAVDRLSRLEPYLIELCEQPIKAGDRSALKMISRNSPIPVFADEDVCDSHDVAALVGAVDGVNLKLRKTGGIRELIKAAAVARAHGMGLMIGCDLDTGVAATAGAHIASLTDHVDLDGPLLLAEDPYPGVGYLRGVLTLPDGPGLGVAGK